MNRSYFSADEVNSPSSTGPRNSVWATTVQIVEDERLGRGDSRLDRADARLSSRRLARRAGRSGDSRARRPAGPPRRAPGLASSAVCVCFRPRLESPDRQRPSAKGAGSGRRCQVLVEGLGWGPPAERLAGPRVQRRGDGGEILGAVPGEVGALGEVLAQQPVGVLVAAALPWAAWLAEVDLQAGVDAQRGRAGPSRCPGPRSATAT